MFSVQSKVSDPDFEFHQAGIPGYGKLLLTDKFWFMPNKWIRFFRRDKHCEIRYNKHNLLFVESNIVFVELSIFFQNIEQFDQHIIHLINSMLTVSCSTNPAWLIIASISAKDQSSQRRFFKQECMSNPSHISIHNLRLRTLPTMAGDLWPTAKDFSNSAKIVLLT